MIGPTNIHQHFTCLVGIKILVWLKEEKLTNDLFTEEMRGMCVAAESSIIIVLPLACALSILSTANCINLTFCSGTVVCRCSKSGKMHSYRLLWGT